MLKTSLPETIEYLDAILLESMVCTIIDSTRKWITNITKYELNDKERKKYNDIIKKNTKLGFEKLYMALKKYIYDEINYIELFEERIEELEKDNRKILIFSNSKNEADDIANKIKNIGRYPDISKDHVVASINEAGFGLNNLTDFDTILTRPPNYDVLPQLKGRLDRPNQKANTLYLEYILLENTIEEAQLIKLDMANSFFEKHIMPLSKFYELAVTFK